MGDLADQELETRKVSKEEAAFILGQGGKTKAKLCIVSGAQIELTEIQGAGAATSAPQARDRDRAAGSTLQIRGTPRQRQCARKYIEFVLAQRVGPVRIDDPSAHDDLTLLTVPAGTVSFITGKGGSFLRLVEEEWGALLFFLQVNPKNPPTHVNPSGTEKLAIFGPERSRRGAELKVMAAIEMKMPGHFTKTVTDFVSPAEGFSTDTMPIQEDDYSYALGKSGATRKKLARASNCIVEYVGRVAYFAGTKRERACAKEYLTWLLRQRVGEHVHVEPEGRDDVTSVKVPGHCIGYVTGHKGSTLRSIEEETSTFCFIEGAADQTEETKPLLIFGNKDDRRLAESLVCEKISQKWPDEGQEYGGWGKRSSGKGKGKSNDYGSDYGKGKGRRDYSQSWVPKDNYERAADRERRTGEESESMTITEDDAAFIMGPTGKTKRKIMLVSGANLDLQNRNLEITGTPEERERAKKYVRLVMAQRLGPVRLEDPTQHNDLTIIEVPAEAVSFVTGKQGSFLRLVEEEFSTLLFFLDFNKSSKRDQLERLAIFGGLRERRGAELKVMAAIEMKKPGYFTDRDKNLPMQDPSEGFATDRMPIEEDDYSYALGKGGATRKKIARASNCVIEYIGRLAYMSGYKKERLRGREYLIWLFRQRVGPVEVEYANREDVTVLQVPKDCVGFVTGHKGTALRAVEEETGTFCFIEGGRDDPHRDPKPLLIFGGPEARASAEEKVRKRIEQKQEEGWVHEEWSSGYSGGWGSGYGGGYGDNEWRSEGKGQKWKGDGKGRSKGGKENGRSYGGWGEDRGTAGAAPTNGGATEPSPAAASSHEAGEDPASHQEEEEGTWGDWGGASDDDGTDAPKTNGGPGGNLRGLMHADQKANLQLLGATGRWGYAGHPAQNIGSSPGRGLGYSPSRLQEELDLPPQLLHEEAWPELGNMGAPAPKGKAKK